MNENERKAGEWQAEEFERSRSHLRAVAYRMLGSSSEADDALQEAWIRFARTDTGVVENLRGWLTTVVSRVCLDMLRARVARREDALDVPSVTLEDSSDPEQEALLADSVGIALLVVLETLSPAERLAFVLHDMFGVSFDEIAPIVERNPAAARQLASRARRRVRGAAPKPDASLARQRQLVDAFLAASQRGDFEALVAVLDPDVVFRVRGGTALPATVHGAEEVARTVLERGAPFARFGRPALVNGAAGILVGPLEHPIAVAAFTVARGRIASVDVIASPTIAG